MKFETKYNIGDEVWVIHDNEVCRTEITDINIRIVGKVFVESPRYVSAIHSVEYMLNRGYWVAEHKLFPTKEELLKSL